MFHTRRKGRVWREGRRRRRSIRMSLLIAGAAAGGVLALWLLQGPGPPAGSGEAPDRASRPTEPRDAARTSGPPDSEPTADAPLWSALDESDVDVLPRYAPQWSAEGRVLVRVTEAANAARGWQVGDRVALPLPQLGVVYRPAIEELDIGPGPSISALGKVLGDDGRLRRFVVTVGPAHVFAYMDTPRGPYELVGGEELGWLLPTSSMMAGFDFSEPDYVVPGERGAEGSP